MEQLRLGFEHGKRLGLMIRNEDAHAVYSTNVLCAIFEAESNDLFEVRQTILGHVQQGGDPSPFDRIQATRFAARCIDFLIEQAQSPEPAGAFIGLEAGGIDAALAGRNTQDGGQGQSAAQAAVVDGCAAHRQADVAADAELANEQ